ncbi:MAG: ABC transporter permease [Candidatus Bathyarchaeota archaeon]|uniref:ABC transporter permease n=1 Tax=Candidatus Bathycorpusculum sp. TaxID=2994959 RepID=UPI00281BAB39|nr:ABC transporter permease [Candidatus Termiticorpusculum sp.]MCL2258161.1 ABC transporter permease [Candidatus Termiticorpusculum sp.]MCL2291547.1 ABC transporter permease [Candidatus Termiticorpusculum sp.]
MGILTRATKNLYRRKTRTIIVIIALTLALTLLTVLPPSINERANLTQQAIESFVEWNDIVARDVTLSATEIQCEYGDNFDQIIGTDGYLANILMNQSLYHAIVSIPDVNTVIPILDDYPDANRSYRIYGVPLSDSSYLKNPTILPVNITAGRNLQVGDSGVIIIDEIIAKNFSWSECWNAGNTLEEAVAQLYAKDYVVHIGDSFEVLDRKFTVVGIEGYSFELSPHGVTMSLADAWAVTGKSGSATKYLLFVDDVDSVGSVVARIQNLDPHLLLSAGYLQLNSASEVLSQLDDLTSSAQSELIRIHGIGTFEVVLAAVVVVVVILFMMLFSVRERTKEIGTLKAMGASDSTVLSQFMFEGMLLCLIAVGISIIVSIFAMPPVSNILLPMPVVNYPVLSFYPNGTRYISTDMSMSGIAPPAAVTFELVLFVVGLALLLGALGSLYPALKAARTKPAEAMKYE